MAMSGVFLVMVFVNGGFKYAINVIKGRLGERMLRRFRYELYTRILRFPLSHFRRVSQGELIPMITAEVEPLGGYIGDAIAQPVLQGGTLLTIVIFMFIQEPILGLAAISLYPIQGYIIPRLQRKVNRLGKERVKAVRSSPSRSGSRSRAFRRSGPMTPPAGSLPASPASWVSSTISATRSFSGSSSSSFSTISLTSSHPSSSIRSAATW